jgi:peptidoglycan hydrolase CwlO-like protein
VLWVIFQFYANQNTISEKSESNKKNIERLETSLNKLDRKVVEVQATANSLKEQMANDRQFYLATQVPGRR